MPSVLQLLTHLCPLVTTASRAGGLSSSSWITTQSGRPSTSPPPPPAPRGLPGPPCPGRAPNSSPSTPTWTPRPAPWPRAAAPPRWERASRFALRRAPPPSPRAGGLAGSSRRPCSRPLLSPPHQHRPSYQVVTHIPQLQFHPPLSPRTSHPLASRSPNSLSALAAASAWTWVRARAGPGAWRGLVLPPQTPDVTSHLLQGVKVRQPVIYWRWVRN